MLSHEPSLNPPFDHFQEEILPKKCFERIKKFCMEFLDKGDSKSYPYLFDYLYEQVEAHIIHETILEKESCDDYE